MPHISGVATGTGIHGSEQLKFRWELEPIIGATQRNLTRLQRLSQGIEYTGFEFREFIEKQYPPVGKADLARTRLAATTNQRHTGGGVF